MKANKVRHPKLDSTKISVVILAALTLFLGVYVARFSKMEPFHALGGVVWFNNGVHYLSANEVTEKTETIMSPKLASARKKVEESTKKCDEIDTGFCQQTPGYFVEKTMTKAPIAFVPAMPERKEVLSVCTLCNDGTFSPSCAVGRGACSHHDGVASYGVERYRIIPGTPEVKAEPAEYSYEPKSVSTSPDYVKPIEATLAEIVGF